MGLSKDTAASEAEAGLELGSLDSLLKVPMLSL